MTAPVRLYDHLFTKPDPDEVPAGQTYLVNLNPNSLEVLSDCAPGTEFGRGQAGRALPVRTQRLFHRGCYRFDPGKPVFNRTVTLKDTWAKIEQKRAGR